MIVNYGGRSGGRVTPASVAASISLFQTYTSEAISVSSPPANKFDLIAEVTFTGRTSSTVRRTQMYWDGTANQYRFRFFGERAEIWDYEITADGSTGNIETTTNVAELDGVTGAIEVTEDSTAYGLIKANGNRWARQKGAHDTLEDFVPNARMAIVEDMATWSNSLIDSEVSQAVDTEKFNGVFCFLAGYMIDIDSGSEFPLASNGDPDTSVFDFVERMLYQTASRDAFVHFWYTGDAARDQRPATRSTWTNDVSDAEHQRLARYFCARLAAYPNWLMGYGYDNPEDVTSTDFDGWESFFDARMGWPHLFGARDQDGGNGYTYWPGADFVSKGNDFTQPSYSRLKGVYDGQTTRPTSLDERYWLARETLVEIRQILHRSTVAGGVGGIYGSDGTNNANDYSTSVPFATYASCWPASRFDGFVDADSLISGTGSVGGLRKSDSTVFVFYVEGSGSDQTLDLSGAPSGPLSVKLIDTTVAYSEQSHANVSNASGQVISLPSSSDWVIVIGE